MGHKRSNRVGKDVRVIRIGCLRMVEARALAVRALYDLKGIILEFEIEKKNKN